MSLLSFLHTYFSSWIILTLTSLDYINYYFTFILCSTFHLFTLLHFTFTPNFQYVFHIVWYNFNLLSISNSRYSFCAFLFPCSCFNGWLFFPLNRACGRVCMKCGRKLLPQLRRKWCHAPWVCLQQSVCLEQLCMLDVPQPWLGVNSRCRYFPVSDSTRCWCHNRRSDPSCFSTTQYQSNSSVKLEILLSDSSGSGSIYRQHPLAGLLMDGTRLQAICRGNTLLLQLAACGCWPL